MDLSAAVNTLFDRLERYTPVFVPRGPSTKTAAAVTLLMLALVGVALSKRLRDALASEAAEDIAREVAIAVGAVVAVLACGSKLQTTLYDFQMHVANRQHFTNLKWIPLYLQAAGACGS